MGFKIGEIFVFSLGRGALALQPVDILNFV